MFVCLFVCFWVLCPTKNLRELKGEAKSTQQRAHSKDSFSRWRISWFTWEEKDFLTLTYRTVLVVIEEYFAVPLAVIIFYESQSVVSW